MQFTMQSTAALAIFVLALPALSSPLQSQTSSISLAMPSTTNQPTSSGPLTNSFHPDVPNDGAQTNGQSGKNGQNSQNKQSDKENTSKIVSALKTYHDQVNQELTQCSAQNSVEKCLSRLNGHIKG
jgi:hypothetical protein